MDRSDMDDKPKGELLERIKQCKLLGKEDSETTFGQVISSGRTVTIFIRHWFCSVCQSYCKHIAASVPPSSLPHGTSIVIIGCGGYQPMDFYYNKTGLPREYKLFADPTRTIHDENHFNFHLGMPGGKEGEQKDYEERLGGFWARATQSWAMGLRDPMLVPYTGSPLQNGGEFIFEQGEAPRTTLRQMEHDLLPIVCAILAITPRCKSSPRPSVQSILPLHLKHALLRRGFAPPSPASPPASSAP